MRPDDIANALRAALRERVFRPGQALNQDELARRFGVSRIPLREALRTLVGEGLVVMKPGLGAVVTELSAPQVEELYGLRLQLEPPLAPYVVERVRKRDVDELARMVESMADLAPMRSDEWSSLNYTFLRRLYELSERGHTLRLVVQVLNLVEPYTRVHAHVLGQRSLMLEQRRATVEVLRTGDPDRLRTLIAESIEAARAELLASMPGPVEPAGDPMLDRLRRA